MEHYPVLLQEVIAFLRPRKGEDFIDATIGQGGHSREILLATAPTGRLLGIDWDKSSLKSAKKNLAEFSRRPVLAEGNFSDIDSIAQKQGFSRVSGILFDLGFATSQLKTLPGLSFMTDSQLDMNVSGRPVMLYGRQYRRVEEIIKRMPEKDLANLLYQYGDIRRSWAVAKRIKRGAEHRPLTTTKELVQAIGVSDPRILAPIFQAFRIAINDEFNNLIAGLSAAVNLLTPGGRLAVISFHSGEDRIVKNFFRQRQELKIITAKPVMATDEEVDKNPHSRSAKLRAAIKVKSKK